MSAGGERTIFVTGDVTVDWRIAQSQTLENLSTGVRWDPTYYVQAYPPQAGGASLLGSLIQSAAGSSRVVVPAALRHPPPLPGTRGLWHSYALCRQFARTKDSKEKVWRIAEFIGVDRQQPTESEVKSDVRDEGEATADLVVLDDQSLNFRDEYWPKPLRQPKKDAWLLLRIARPDFKQPTDYEKKLWRAIRNKFEKRLIVVVKADDLRQKGVRICRALSWEQTVEDIQTAMRAVQVPECAHLVVSFEAEAAIVLSGYRPKEQRVTLYYDPCSSEGSWTESFPGKMAGYTQCVAAGIAVHMIQNLNSSDIDPGPGVLAGLASARRLLEVGFEATGKRPKSPFPIELNFPVAAVAEVIRGVVNDRNCLTQPFRKAPGIFQATARGHHTWSILEARPDPLKLARDIVFFGLDDDQWDFPVAKFGELIVVDRAEIQSLRTVRALIAEYERSPSENTPLSIAVFGSPGSGKSFAIREIAKSLSSDGRVRELTFNVSQFTSPQAIIDGLHQVRDEALTGAVPLIFWDEFDARFGEIDLGWLRYFLAPMQDGKFQEGPVLHNIGRAVFVFAGGNYPTLESFELGVCEPEKLPAAGSSAASSLVTASTPEARSSNGNLRSGTGVKGSDFLSRLKGFVDIAKLDFESDLVLAPVLVRRALLLRSFLLSYDNLVQHADDSDRRADGAPEASHKPRRGKRLNVDAGVLDAFLRVPRYRYGARSMKSLVRMSVLGGRSSFESSSLPPLAQLSLHVDGTVFMNLVSSYEE